MIVFVMLLGMHTGLMKEVCALTLNAGMRSLVLKTICDHLKNDRLISTDDAKSCNKALLLFEYVLLNAFEETVGDLLDRISYVQDLKQYNMHEVSQYSYGKDCDKGAAVRKKATQMVELMQDHGESTFIFTFCLLWPDMH